MKFRSVIVIILCIALFSTACHRIDPPSAETSIPPATAEATEPTSPTSAPTEPEPEIPLWYKQDLQHESYEAFFSADHTLSAFSSNRYYWYVRHGDTLVRAGFDPFQDAGFLVVKSGETEYPVPVSTDLTNYSRIGADGKYVYLSSDTDIIRIDLFTGETEILFTCDRLLRVYSYDNLVLMILAETGGAWNICRIYIPTMDTEIFYEGIPTDTPLYTFDFSGRYSTQAPFIWTMMNPEMSALLRKELANPDSIYIVNDFTGYPSDYSSIWNDMTLDTANEYDAPPDCLLHEIQNHSGIHAWVKCAYNPADGSYEETTGIVDNCSYGSGYAHDHYDPKEYDVTPSWNISEPVPIDNISLPEDPQKMYEEDVYASRSDAYIYIDGYICRQAETDVLQILLEIDLTEVYFAPDFLYGITPDHTLMQISYDGTVRNTIYTADTSLSELTYGSGKLYFLENETTLMEIDIPAQTCRSLLEIPSHYYYRMYLDAPNVLFLNNARGLSDGMFIVDFSQLTIEKTHRL